VWKGATPSFIKIAKTINSILVVDTKALTTEKIIKRMEAKLCTRKYFTEFSISRLLSKDEIIGINLSMFNSRPTHMHKNELELAIIINLIIKKK